MRRAVPLALAVGTAVAVAVAVPARAAPPRPPTAPAAATVSCAFGGPTPGGRVARLDLPRGSDFLDLRLTVAPPDRPVGSRTSWHLVQGVAVVDARTGALVAARVGSWGSAPRRVVARAAGADVLAADVGGPDAPFVHRAGTTVASLPPGSYDVVAFGSDGDPRLPNPPWGAEVRAAGPASCRAVGGADVFDVDQTVSQGGTVVAAYGAGVVRGASVEMRTRRRRVFAVVDAATQGAGDATVACTPPGRPRVVVRQALAPFVWGGGRTRCALDAAGAFPLALVAGAAFDG